MISPYLRDAFGPVCDALKVNSRILSAKAKKRFPQPGQDRRRKAPVIEAGSFEQITTAQIAEFISGEVASRGLAPKTANRYREILTRLFNWSMTHNGVQLPSDKNPASSFERYREPLRWAVTPATKTWEQAPRVEVTTFVRPRKPAAPVS
jgi:hypothetical protein